MSVMNHLRELRRRLVIALLIISAGAILGWVFYNPILQVLKDPYCAVPYTHRLGGHAGDKHDCQLYYYAPLDGFTNRLKISFAAGAVLTAPFWLYQMWAFIAPGLRRNERKYTRVFVAASTLLFAAGVALAYVVLYKGLPILIRLSGSGVSASLTITEYLDFVVKTLLVFGAMFELPLLTVMANQVGVLPASLLKRTQRIGIFLIFVFAAIATPSPDPFTMCAVAIPICLLYEGAVLIAVVHDRRKAKRDAEPPPPEDDVPSAVDPFPTPLEESHDQTT